MSQYNQMTVKLDEPFIVGVYTCTFKLRYKPDNKKALILTVMPDKRTRFCSPKKDATTYTVEVNGQLVTCDLTQSANEDIDAPLWDVM